MMFNVVLIAGGSMIAIVGLIYLINRIVNKNKPANHNDQPVQCFKQWNAAITTKQGFIDMYNQLNEYCLNVYNCPLTVNMTKEEFDRLSIESIRKLNDEALDQLPTR